MIRILNIIEDTTVDGPGFRTSIYAAGCHHKCPSCHNPQSWDFYGGYEISTEDVMKVIEADPYADVTFSGGDPLYQLDGFTELARTIKERTHKTIWCYTGFLFEELLKNDKAVEFLKNIDVLVDGPFIEAEKDEDVLFRGSRNQRLIDVIPSLACGYAIAYDLEDQLKVKL